MQQGTRSGVCWKLEYIMAEVSSPDEYQANLMRTAPAAICPELCLTHKPEHKHHLNTSERANFINIFNKVYSNGKGYPCIAGNKSGFWMCSPRLPQITISLHQVNVSSKYLPAEWQYTNSYLHIFVWYQWTALLLLARAFSNCCRFCISRNWTTSKQIKKKSAGKAVIYTELLKTYKRGLFKNFNQLNPQPVCNKKKHQALWIDKQALIYIKSSKFHPFASDESKPFTLFACKVKNAARKKEN